MKRTLTFVISFTLSFLFFFSSMAMAEEVKTPIPQVTSKLTNPEIILQASPVNLEKSSPNPVSKVNPKVFENALRAKKKPPSSARCNVIPPQCWINETEGYYLGRGGDRETALSCVPCDSARPGSERPERI